MQPTGTRFNTCVFSCRKPCLFPNLILSEWDYNLKNKIAYGI